MSVTLSDDQGRKAMQALMEGRDTIGMMFEVVKYSPAERRAMQQRAKRYGELAIDIWNELEGGKDGTGDAGDAGVGAETGVR